jgi:hypothetical protein
MGFLDKLKEGVKKVADRVTGGYGKIELTMDRTEFAPGDQLSFSAIVLATGELKAKRVLLRLRGVESCDFEHSIDEKDADGTTQTRKVRETHTEYTLDKEYELHGELNMKEGENLPLVQTVTLPSDCRPTYRGIACNHQWSVTAEVDVPFGADPRSEKQIIIR